MSISTSISDFSVDLPDGPRRSQDAETVVVRWPEGGRSEEIRLHEYPRLFSVPGLYETIVQELLECRSPAQVVEAMTDAWADLGRSPGDARLLDVGAGNGVVGEMLADRGVEHLVGLDILDEARLAAERDRPGVYRDYLSVDLLDLDPDAESSLREHSFNSLCCVAALGFGDIPPAAFAKALELVETGSLIGLTINESFLDERGSEGFAGFIHGLIDEGLLDVKSSERFPHRRAVTGEWLYYVALVAVKTGPVPIPR